MPQGRREALKSLVECVEGCVERTRELLEVTVEGIVLVFLKGFQSKKLWALFTISLRYGTYRKGLEIFQVP